MSAPSTTTRDGPADAKVLIAFGGGGPCAPHTGRDVVHEPTDHFATCPVTPGAPVRLVVRQGASADQAIQVITSFTSREGHEFWPDDLAYDEVAMAGVIGHRQVTDAYLAASARRRGGRLATFDGCLATLHPDVTILPPPPSRCRRRRRQRLSGPTSALEGVRSGITACW